MLAVLVPPALRKAASLSFVAAASLIVSGSSASADTASFTTPSLDRWMYPFSPTGSNGARGTASVFGAVGNPGFDERDAQFVIGFKTSPAVPAGLGSSQYVITSARLTTVDSAGGYTFDGTYDSVHTYGATPSDTDPGRPFELHGAGFRNGYTALAYGAGDNSPPGFKEGSNFSTTAQPASSTRSVYPLGFDSLGNARDVSNNVTGGFESNAWAIGQAVGVAQGAVVPADTPFTFDLNVTELSIQGYLQNALNTGNLGLVMSSLLDASQQSTAGIPQFYNKENAAHNPAAGSFVAPAITIQYTIVPEPSSALVAGLASAGLLTRRRSR